MISIHFSQVIRENSTTYLLVFVQLRYAKNDVIEGIVESCSTTDKSLLMNDKESEGDAEEGEDEEEDEGEDEDEEDEEEEEEEEEEEPPMSPETRDSICEVSWCFIRSLH